ncbi:hypothetical protein [Embleya hyalina]|uniref:Lipoprotein n=1 Tax=Embleya hyalina TaxID=516124 RepID=A0A401YF51_9ACTN|nr:hypothetical protein [Embleya hyalina]GCD93209.1 hypothetical protein EHYA_00852 [Embleya hyalina]
MSSTTPVRPAWARWRRRTAAAVVSLLVVTGLVAVTAPTAHAVASTTCTGTSQLGYSPGLTLTPQTVTVSASDSVPTCTSTDPTITGVIMSPYSYPVANAACNSVQVDPGNVLVIHWNNAQTSTVTGLTYTTAVVAGVSVSTGTGTVAAAVVTWLYPLVNPLLRPYMQGEVASKYVSAN